MAKSPEYFAARDLILASKETGAAIPPMKRFKLNLAYARFVVAAQIRKFEFEHASKTVRFDMYGSTVPLIISESELNPFWPLNVGDMLVLNGDYYITVPYGDFIKSITEG